ncbi:MAG: stage III sporulation protein AA [Clostridia bacterium]|nr:stage III sporulation protein AA [Clostridia bacterium]
MKETDEILRYFPNNIYQIFFNLFKENNKIINEIQEIRMRANRPILLKLREKDLILQYNISQSEMLQILERLCENSIYAYKNQICEGFITVKGGHRVGLTGSCVIENGKITNIKYISSLNFRIAREILNCSTRILREVIDIENKTIYNSIIVAPPGRGKTTVLRDIIRRLSNGIDEINFKGKTCGVVDERGEIAAMYKGVPQNDVGVRTDVIENVNKNKGIHMLIRTMAPEIIACDEIGSREDVDAIHYALFSGVKGIFTMHGKSIEDIKNNRQIYELIENREIQKIVFL